MTFKAYVLPGVRAFTTSMRVKLSRELNPVHPIAAPFSTPASSAKPAQHSVHWRVSPTTGLLEQRRGVDDFLDSQSRVWH